MPPTLSQGGVKMVTPDMQFSAKSDAQPEMEAFRSWKEIASYLGRSVRTVQRWEKEYGLPVHRASLSQRGAIYAYPRELREWWSARSVSLETEPEQKAAQPGPVQVSMVMPVQNRVFPKLWKLGLLITLTPVVVMLVMVSATRRPPLAPHTLFTGTLIETRPGMNMQPSLSPDGAHIAFVSGTAGRDIYLEKLGADVFQPLTSTHAALSFAWAPDGKHLAYLEARDASTAELRIADLDARRDWCVRDVNYADEVFPRGSLLSWTPDGTSVVLTDRPEKDKGAGLFAVSVRDGSLKRLTSPPVGFDWRDITPRISPDGRMLAFVREQAPNKLKLCIVPFSNTAMDALYTPDCLDLSQQRIYGFTFGADSRTLIASLASTGLAGELWSIPLRSPHRATRIPLADESTFEPSFENGRLAYVAGGIRVELKEYGVEDGRARKERIAAPSTRIEIFPELSPDGSRLAFVSNRSGAYDIWMVAANGETDARRVSRLNGGTAGNIKWSHDGQQLAFAEKVNGKPGIYTVALDGGAPERLNIPESDRCTISAFSRDGHGLYLSCERADRTVLVRFDFNSKQEQQIATAPKGSYLELTPDQTGVFELDPGGIGLVRLDLSNQARTVVVPGRWSEFDIDESGILLAPLKTPGQNHCFSRYSFKTHQVSAIDSCSCTGPGATMSQDGRHLVCAAADVSTELKYVLLEQ